IVDEIVDAVVIGKAALRLEAVLPEQADLDSVWTPDLREARRQVASRIEVEKGRVVRADVRTVCNPPAVEDELWRRVNLHGIWEQHRDAGQVESRPVELRVVRQDVNRVVGLAEGHLQHGRRVE